MGLVFHSGRLAAIAGAERCWLAPHIDVLEDDHPVKRFVCAMCLYARELELGRLAGPYDQEEAERYARAVLLPDDEFERLAAAGWCDCCLAERFNLALEQVRIARAERVFTGWM